MKTIDPTTDFKAAFESWITKCQSLLDDYITKHYPNIPRELLSTNDGKKYLKIVKHGSAWAFVDKVSGDIFKPASWATPAKHARGNIFDDSNGMKHIGPYGPAYLR